MAASQPSKRRRVPVRLTDVPIEVRLRAARAESRNAKSDREREALIAAALSPDETVFYVTDDDLGVVERAA